MNKRWPTQGLAVLLCALQIIPALAQNPAPTTPAPAATPDRSPQVTVNSGFWNRSEYKPGSVSSSDFRDTTRLTDLIREGQLYLSLDDAIALALENNLDLELERYGLRMAANTFRAYKSSMKRLAANRANPAHLSAPVDGADPLAAARQVKALVEQFGAETVKGLADLFGPG